jgi:hypothetical protein
MVRHCPALLSRKRHVDFVQRLCCLGLIRQEFLQFLAWVVSAVGAGFHFLGFGAGSYFADLGAPSRDFGRHAPCTVDVFWAELDIERFSPAFGHFPLALKVLVLSCDKRVAFATIQPTIGDHFGHGSQPSCLHRNGCLDDADLRDKSPTGG